MPLLWIPRPTRHVSDWDRTLTRSKYCSPTKTINWRSACVCVCVCIEGFISIPKHNKPLTTEKGKRVCASYMQECSKRNIKCTTVLLTHGRAQEDAVDFCKHNQVDTIFVGSRGLGSFQRVLLGSFSNYVVNHSSCTVVVVRKPNTASPSWPDCLMVWSVESPFDKPNTTTSVWLLIYIFFWSMNEWREKRLK